MKYRCLSASIAEYWGTDLSHRLQFACAANPKAVGQRAAAALLLLSTWEGVHGGCWLCLLIQCQHSWMGVEGEVMCTRKSAGTDYIICRVRDHTGTESQLQFHVCSVGIEAMHCPLFRAECSGTRLVCDFCCFNLVSSVILNVCVDLYKNLCSVTIQAQTPTVCMCCWHALHSSICAFSLPFASHYVCAT